MTNTVCIGYTYDKTGHSQSNQVVINLNDEESIKKGLRALRTVLQEFDDLVYDRICEACDGEGWVWAPNGYDVARDPCPRCGGSESRQISR